jgi:hypothetical protein
VPSNRRSLIDRLMRFKGTSLDFAAGTAAYVIRHWKDPEDRAWFAVCLRTTADLVEGNTEMKVPLMELPRTTARRLKERSG